MHVYRLLIQAPDKQGLVALVSQFIAEYKGNIVAADHYLDQKNKQFFMRNEIEANTLLCSLQIFKEDFSVLAKLHQISWSLSDSKQPKKILLMGSNATHCVADLLHRYHEQELEGQIVGVLSNHKKLAKLASWYDVKFKHVEINNNNKKKGIENMTSAVAEFNPDVIVLARYMQIIPKKMCDEYQGRIINIHHSFLPSFIGGNPYQKASERGVKLIGATCHYVSQELDNGPIIEQDVIRVNHAHSIEKMKKMGQDVEKITLAKGLQYHLEDRVLISNNKTIIFN
jgi:formyltetrahydrofolate deformylase